MTSIDVLLQKVDETKKRVQSRLHYYKQRTTDSNVNFDNFQADNTPAGSPESAYNAAGIL